VKYLVGLSGGKDSTAVMLWVIHESEYSPADVIFNFTDGHNEAQCTYDYISYLSAYAEQHGYSPIHWLAPDLDFWQLARKKQRFPSIKARFCTQHLKIKPLQAFIATISDQVVSISGVRADESAARSQLPERAFNAAGYQVFRPILAWSEAHVFAYLRRWNVPRNPLYDLGFSRVGCFPCVNARKKQIRLIATHFPEVIDKIRQAERDGHTFFARTYVPKAHRHSIFQNTNGRWEVPAIDDVVRWSFTTRGGKQYALPQDLQTLAALDRLKPTPTAPIPAS